MAAATTRANDSDRNDTCGVLDSALSKGQLSEEEHRQRVSTATNAKTLGELQSLVSDLRSGDPAARATDNDRNNTCQLLDTALSKGQLSMEEHRQRVSTATNAKTLGELQWLGSDLQHRQAAARATDSDRDDTCQVLDTAMSDGELSMEEHRQRVSAATNAKTLGELQSLVSDLQSQQSAQRRRKAWSRPAVWLIVVIGVLALAAGVAMVHAMTQRPSRQANRPATTAVTSTVPTAVPTGGTLTVTQDSSTTETIACNNGDLTLKGSSGTYVVTGHCASLTLPGNDMNVTVDNSDAITVSGKRITVLDKECNNGDLTLSGDSRGNVFHGHGHCASITVSGSDNNVTVETVDTIEASGGSNKVTWLSGTANVTDFGHRNVFVGQR